MSQKTSVTGTLGQLERMGIINDGSGNVAAMTVKWEASPKFLIESGYSFNQPAVGETVDAPFQIQTYFIAARWDLTSKITVNSKGTYVERRYEGLDGELERIEALTILAPLVISYEPYRFVNITLDTGWRDNKSPRIDREYSSYQSALSIKFIY